MSEANEIVSKVSILDDTSIDADTLGKRRLLLKEKGVPLLRINKVFYFVGDIIKSSSNMFIDNTGRLFKYTKTRSVPLIFRKIIKKWNNPIGAGTIIEVDGIPTRFKTLSRSGHSVAGLLEVDNGFILYGTYNEMYKDTRRKV